MRSDLTCNPAHQCYHHPICSCCAPWVVPWDIPREGRAPVRTGRRHRVFQQDQPCECGSSGSYPEHQDLVRKKWYTTLFLATGAPSWPRIFWELSTILRDSPWDLLSRDASGSSLACARAISRTALKRRFVKTRHTCVKSLMMRSAHQNRTIAIASDCGVDTSLKSQIHSDCPSHP